MRRKHKSNLFQSSNKARVMKAARLNEPFPQTELQRLEQAECTGGKDGIVMLLFVVNSQHVGYYVVPSAGGFMS
ncbi:hypothetical protein TNCV_2397661 [Trichonephila clavipes]|uniref:Uncharacterized protein n=1 Tax=Trichonephila clavipes TaxID=2585209 RepID=A0A8X6SW82_TRICX|nr:hypothetical protein TNCV_2397661 [Trichonephila clavipes]